MCMRPSTNNSEEQFVTKKNALVTIAILSRALAFTGMAASQTESFDFSYSRPGMQATGTLTGYLDSSYAPYVFQFTGITGEYNNQPILDLVNYDGGCNLLYAYGGPSWLGGSGISFDVDGGGWINLSFDHSNYWTFDSGTGKTDRVTANFAAAAPEPSTLPLAAGGLIGFTAVIR